MLTYILSFMIALMSLTSVYSIDNHVGKFESKSHSCCNSKHKKASLPRNCCNGICNPFMACCGFYHQVSRIEFESENVFLEKLSFHHEDENCLTEFVSQSWHPPKMIM